MLTDLNGKLGGVSARGDVCGIHIQKQPRVIRGQPSEEQLTQRDSWKAVCSYWKRYMTGEGEQIWWVWCANHPIVNKKGEELFLTPFQAFLHVNVPRHNDGLPILIIPPN